MQARVCANVMVMALVTLMLPSCYYKILKKEFPQGTAHEKNVDVVVDNMRSVSVYDQFATRAHFDVLNLTDDVRKEYADLHTKKHGKDESYRNALLRRQLEENKHWLSFVVLANVQTDGPKLLTDPHAPWTFYLRTAKGKNAVPQSVEEIELSPEYRSIFGHRLSEFKTPYLIKFASGDVPQVRSGAPFKLVASSTDRDIELYWGDHPALKTKKRGKRVRIIKRTRKEKIGKDEDIYW